MRRLKKKKVKDKLEIKSDIPYNPNKGIEPNLDFLNQKGETIRSPEQI